jgi:hypothetical protein
MSKKHQNSKIYEEGHRRTYQVSEIADPTDPKYQTAAGGNVFGAIASGFQHFLRTIVPMPPGSCSAKLLFIYRPVGNDKNSQERLKFYVQLEAIDSETSCNLDSLLRGCMASCFYNFEAIQKIPDEKQLHVGCRIIRRMDYLKPLYSCEVNPKIPRSYCTISSFTPNEDNDYLKLDRVLDRITEPVTISIMVKPVDISQQIHAHTTYMANLADINRWDRDYEDFCGIDYTGSGDHSYLKSQNQVKILNYPEPMAKDVMQIERQIHKTLPEPHLSFRIEVKAESKSVALLVASTVGEAGFKDGRYRIISSENNEKLSDGLSEACWQEADTSVCTLSHDVDGDRESEEYEQLKPLSIVCTVEELSGIFRLPIASSPPLCCRKNTDPPHIDEKNLVFLGYKEESLTGSASPIALGIPIDVLAKHLAVFGLPGGGKSTNNMGILYQLHARDIRFMVIECAKREYRAMKMFKKHKDVNIRSLAEQLHVFTPGLEHVSPFQLNPFKVPKGITIAEHMQKIKSDIKASIPVSVGSLPALLAEAIEKVYEDFPDHTRPPVMTDLIDKINTVLAAKGYSSETRSDMQTAIEVRLGSLAQGAIGKIFQGRQGISIEYLMKVPSIIELDGLQQEEACLLVLSILSQVCEYLKAGPPPAEGIVYVIMIEEAHVIFGSNNNTPASEEIADTKSILSDMISKMLVTFRALKCSIILSSQHPTKLDSAASLSVGSKQTFRLVHSTDRKEMGMSMLFKDREMQNIARLIPGLSYFITEGFFGPQLIKTPDLGKELDLFPPPSHQELLKVICRDKWFQEAKMNRISDGLDQLKENMDQYDKKKEKVRKDVMKLLKAYQHLLGQGDGQLKRQRLIALEQILRALRGKLISSYNKFNDGPYRRFSHLLDELSGQGSDLRAFGECLNRRFETAIKSGTRDLLVVMDKLTKNYKKLKFKGNDHAK